MPEWLRMTAEVLQRMKPYSKKVPYPIGKSVQDSKCKTDHVGYIDAER
jgi:hypothetical protein